MKSKTNYFLSLLIATFLLNACASKEDVVYFQNQPITAESNIAFSPSITYKPNDLVSINVSALDPETVKPFNLPVITNTFSSVSYQGEMRIQTYLVDSDGNIEFPVIGTIQIGGLTRQETVNMLREKISEYVKDPIINIRLTNFTVTVLGEVNNPGTFSIEDERISLSEALGMAGDLTIYGKRDNVFLIREKNGVKQYGRFNLTQKNVLNDQNYYLEQNDVIYVEPNKARVRSSAFNQNNAIIISAVATLVTLVAVLVK